MTQKEFNDKLVKLIGQYMDENNVAVTSIAVRSLFEVSADGPKYFITDLEIDTKQKR